MRKLRLAVVIRLAAAGLVLWTLARGLGQLPVAPSVWLAAPLAFGLAKLAGDATVLTLFRDTLVFFYEDMFWELVAFVALGFLAAGLITLAQSLVGGPVAPYIPAFGVYAVYLLAERPQRKGTDGG